MTTITPEALQDAVLRLFLERSLAEETKRQGRDLTKNERVAFKCGLYAGVKFDLHRDGDWEAAAKALKL